MPLDFKKLSDPAYREELRRQREAEDAAAAEQFLADKWLTLHVEQVMEQVDRRERDMIQSVRTRLSMSVGPTPPQRKWMLDIARRMHVEAALPKVSVIDYYTMLDKHSWSFEHVHDRHALDRAILERQRLELLADLSPEHKALFQAFYQHYTISGETYPKPVSPTHA